MEQDSVFSPFSQDDFLLATNSRGHVFGVSYQVATKVGLHLWALPTAPDPTTDDDKTRWRIRLDLNIKF